MLTEHEIKIQTLYSEYSEVIKPLVATIESSFEQMPTVVLNEIRAFNDHLARVYVDGITDEQIDIQLAKAKSHIKRLVYDCYKLLTLYEFMVLEKHEKLLKRCEIEKVNNGNFKPQYDELCKKRVEAVKYAKNNESKNEIKGLHEENSYNFDVAYGASKKLNEYIMENNSNIIWAINKRYVRKGIAVIISASLFLCGVIFTIVFEKLPIVTRFLELLGLN